MSDSFSPRGNFISGQFLLPRESNGSWTIQNPSLPNKPGPKISYDFASIPEAVRAARQAQAGWAGLSLADRSNWLKKWESVLVERKAGCVAALGFETGKPVWDVELEFERTIRLISTLNQEAPKQRLGQPLGVIAGVTASTEAFESIAGFLASALLSGNTMVHKPSEKTVMLAQWFAETLQESGLPAGVWNLIQGDRETGRRLCVHEGVDGILFSGSYDVSIRIKQDTLQQHWKKLMMYTGGKNAILVWEGVDLEKAVEATIESSFSFCGQGAFSASRVIVHRSVFQEFLEKLHHAAKAFRIGPADSNPFMGPMMDHGSVDRYMKFLGVAAREGAELVMRGKALELGKDGGFYVAPSIAVLRDNSIEATKKSVFQQSEMTSPFVTLLESSDVEHAVALANSTQFGLCASVFASEKDTGLLSRNLDFGLILENRACTRRDGSETYIGKKKSGNHRKTGVGLLEECAWPLREK